MTRVLTTDKALSLVGGLEWRPPGDGRASRAALREAQRLTDASHHVLAKAGSQVMYGLHAPLDEQDALPRSAHSAAAIFANASRDSSLAATALLLRLPTNEDGREGRDGRDSRGRDPLYYLVVVEDGLPLIDLVADRAKVLHALGDYEHHALWSDDQVQFPKSQPASLDWLARLPSVGTRLVRLPINLVPAIAAVGVLALCAGGWFAWTQHQQAQQQKDLIKQAQRADPLPRYLAALQASRAQMAASRPDVMRMASGLYGLPVFAAGWQLKTARCESAAGACVATWQRRGGNYAELAKALPAHELQLDAVDGEGAQARRIPELDVARTRWRADVARIDLPQPPALRAAITQGSEHFQQWKLATLSVDWREPTLWPKAADLDAGFAHPQALMRGDLVVKDVPLPLALEVLQTAPGWVSWEGLDLVVADPAGEPRRALNLTITGVFYVATQ